MVCAVFLAGLLVDPPCTLKSVPVWMINDVANVPKHTHVLCVAQYLPGTLRVSILLFFFFFNGHKLLNSLSDLSSGL